MEMNEIHLELLLGRQVVDTSGNPVGRIEEVCAEQQGKDWVVKEYLIGAAAVIERLSAWTIALSILRLFGARKIHGELRIPWNKLDLTDPEHPRLCCTLEELKDLSKQQK